MGTIKLRATRPCLFDGRCVEAGTILTLPAPAVSCVAASIT